MIACINPMTHSHVNSRQGRAGEQAACRNHGCNFPTSGSVKEAQRVPLQGAGGKDGGRDWRPARQPKCGVGDLRVVRKAAKMRAQGMEQQIQRATKLIKEGRAGAAGVAEWTRAPYSFFFCCR